MKLFILLLSLATFPFAASAQTQTQAETDALMRVWEEVTRFHQAGDNERALQAAEQAYGMAIAGWPEDDPSVLNITYVLGSLYHAVGRLPEAEPLLETALAGSRRTLGPNDPETLVRADALAMYYREMNRLDEAERLFQEVLSARERVLGPDHPDTLVSLSRLGYLYRVTGRYHDAVPFFRRAFQTSARLSGKDDPNTLAHMSNLAEMYSSLGQYAEAEPLFEEALTRRKDLLGQDDPATLKTLLNLSNLYLELARYDDAERHILSGIAESKRTLGAENLITLNFEHRLGVLYAKTNRMVEAERILTGVVEASGRDFGLDNLLPLDSLNSLGEVYKATGRLAEAEGLFVDLLDRAERSFGPDHPVTLTALNNLAAIYSDMGRFDEAEPRFVRVLATQEMAFGRDHRDTLITAGNLALVYAETGRFNDAERLYARVVEASAKTLGENHPDTILSIGNLADLYSRIEQPSTAAGLAEVAYKKSVETLGADHPNTLVALNNLAMLQLSSDRSAELVRRMAQLLRTYERTFGSDDPKTQQASKNLAKLRLIRDRSTDAVQRLTQALNDSEDVLGPDHPTSLSIRLNLAVALILRDDSEDDAAATRYLNRALDIWAERLDVELRTGANDEWRGQLIGDSDIRNISVLAALQFPEFGFLGARAVLMTKGKAGETDAALARLVTRHPDPAVLRAAARLQRAEGILNASFRSSDTNQIDSARAERDEARRALFQLVDPPLAFENDTITPDKLSAALPEGAVFLDYGIFTAMDFATAEQGEPHVLLAAYQSGAEVSLFDLGPVFKITEAILATSNTSNLSRNLYPERWLLREVLLDPVKEILDTADELIVSPDGILTRVNFDLLQDPGDREQHLLERMPIRYVASGRTLLERSVDETQPEAAFLGVGVSDFGPHDPARCGTNRMSRPLGGLCPLPNTRAEVERIVQLFDKARLPIRPTLLDSGATEAAVTASMPGTRIIHLATHGGAQLPGLGGEGMNNVGLAFYDIGAPVNQSRIPVPSNDGMLSGAEASRLPLWGTDLIVLSACDTALGSEAGSEGMWSMAYAFRLAGARAVLMTLWKVNDATAPDFMRRFYEALLERQAQSPTEGIQTSMRSALRVTRLWAMREGWSYWDYGAFVLVEN